MSHDDIDDELHELGHWVAAPMKDVGTLDQFHAVTRRAEQVMRKARAGLVEDDSEWTIVLDLPRPPSVNRFMKTLGNKSPVVQKWIVMADAHLLLEKSKWKGGVLPSIVGRYEAKFIFARAALPFDLSNRIKALEDWLQRVGLIENDKHCERLVAVWGDAPAGARVRLRAWEDR